MLGVFSKLRYGLIPGEGFLKYLRYAIGEIILITFGILVAMAINNWNQQRIEQIQVHQYARALIEDLKSDTLRVEGAQRQAERIVRYSEWLAYYVRGRPLDEMDGLVLRYLAWPSSYTPNSWSRTAIDQLRSSGALRQMRNAELVKKISRYVAFTYHLDQDHSEDAAWGRMASDGNLDVFDMNIPRWGALKEAADAHFGEDGPESLEALIIFFANQDVTTSPPLLTDDASVVRRMVNAQLKLRWIMDSRPTWEMPAIRDAAEELIALLEEEYPPLD